MSHELYIKMIKEDMENMSNSGQVTKDQVIEIALEKLAMIDNKEINEAIIEYRKQKNEIIKQTKELNEKIVKLVDECYDSIIKDL